MPQMNPSNPQQEAMRQRQVQPLPKEWQANHELVMQANDHQTWKTHRVSQRVLTWLQAEEQRLVELVSCGAVSQQVDEMKLVADAAQLHAVRRIAKVLYVTANYISAVNKSTGRNNGLAHTNSIDDPTTKSLLYNTGESKPTGIEAAGTS